MNNTQNVTIGLLLVTAGILAALLIGTYASKSYADASVRAAQPGFIMVAGQGSRDGDLLYLIDLRTQRLNVYGYDARAKAMALGAQRELKQLFGD